MPVVNLPDVAPPQKLSVAATMQAAPTLVKILGATFFLPMLLSLGQTLATMGIVGKAWAWGGAPFDLGQALAPNPDQLFTFTLGVVNEGVEWVAAGAAAAGLVLGLVLALNSALVAKVTGRGPLSSWLLTLAPVGLALLLGLPLCLDSIGINDAGTSGWVLMGVVELGVYLFFGLLLALVSCLLVKGIARGAHTSWQATVALVVVALLVGVPSLLAYWTVYSILSVAVTVAVLTLLLTPAVRRYYTKLPPNPVRRGGLAFPVLRSTVKGH